MRVAKVAKVAKVARGVWHGGRGCGRAVCPPTDPDGRGKSAGVSVVCVLRMDVGEGAPPRMQTAASPPVVTTPLQRVPASVV